jgi:phage baseplate assembly protein W
MAYQVLSVNQSDTTENRALGVQLPFNGLFGIFSSTYTTVDQAISNLKNLLLTTKGERPLQPNFGTNLVRLLFEPNTNAIKQNINDVITQPVNFWLPYINIDSIDVVTPLDDPSVEYHLMITITYSVSGIVVDPLRILVDENGSVEIE